MPIYEIGYLILPSIPEDGLSLVVEKIKAAFMKAGGKEVDGEEPFKQELSYTMSKSIGASKYVANEAYLGWHKFELEPSQVLEVKSSLEKIDELLRFLLIKAPRESAFTFAKAKEAMREKLAKEKAEEEGELVEEVVSTDTVVQ